MWANAGAGNLEVKESIIADFETNAPLVSKCFNPSPSSMQTALQSHPGWCSMETALTTKFLCFFNTLKYQLWIHQNIQWCSIRAERHCTYPRCNKVGIQTQLGTNIFLRRTAPWQLRSINRQESLRVDSPGNSEIQQNNSRHCAYPSCNRSGHIDPARKQHFSWEKLSPSSKEASNLNFPTDCLVAVLVMFVLLYTLIMIQTRVFSICFIHPQQKNNPYLSIVSYTVQVRTTNQHLSACPNALI